jgi:hypothetical protein
VEWLGVQPPFSENSRTGRFIRNFERFQPEQKLKYPVFGWHRSGETFSENDA